ncbi:single-stranded DNA-binding protein [Rothia sp. P5764]|uniref:single-stranded DNA-binding protein n=1 Tax=Rothia sp. P5764 TaxID=3402654 RepID=UPI003ABE65B3
MANDTTITIVGNLVADPELRFTPNGAAVTNLTIASTPRTYDRATGEWKEGATLFLRASAWKDHAENIANSLKKGMRVIAQGNLKARTYETKEGQQRTAYELELLEIGPSLRYATAQTTRNQQGGGNFQSGYSGGFGQPQAPAAPQGKPQPDPWAQQAQGNYDWGIGANEEAPF